MKELPKVFHNKKDKKFDNNRSVFYSNNTYEEDRSVDTRTILQKINEIFSSPNYVYNAIVEITL